MTYHIYDFNQVKLFNMGFTTYQKAFDFCLGRFTDEEMKDVIILPLRGDKR